MQASGPQTEEIKGCLSGDLRSPSAAGSFARSLCGDRLFYYRQASSEAKYIFLAKTKLEKC